jgi:aspartokinase/homoserine dehydrogenase 1
MSTLRQSRARRVGLLRRADFNLRGERAACVQANESVFASSSAPLDAGMRVPQTFPGHAPLPSPVHARCEQNLVRPLRVMKFGGTSVKDASCISRVAEIIRGGLRESNLVVVVSAMSGVTNKLIEAGVRSEAGDHQRVAAIFQELREQHEAVVHSLIHSPEERKQIRQAMRQIFCEGEELCRGGALSGELTPPERDAIAGLGERLSAPLVAAVLAENGVASEALEATELVVTNAHHGGADPRMDLTRERCEARLRTLLRKGVVAVVTGFIGATVEGVLTTLGRGGSDYSATILGAALDADEVIIWTDVDGVLTADPRVVLGARTIPEISYREAADLAHFGAKVLHPKTLRPVMQSEIPVWIRNSFTPERRGTKITPAGANHGGGVKAVTAISDVALITVGGPGIVELPDVLGRTFTATAAARAEVLLISRSSSQNDICFVVSAAQAERTVEALRREFAVELVDEEVEHIMLNPGVAIVAAVGQNMCGEPGIVGRAFGALSRENVSIIAMARDASECNISFLVAQKDMKTALVATHRELQLGERNSQAAPVTSLCSHP